MLYRNGDTIQKLYLSGCLSLDNESLASVLERAPNTEILNLSTWQITSIEPLQQLTELKELYLTDCKKLKVQDLIDFLNKTEA